MCGLPGMTTKEIDIFKNIINLYKNGKIKVLEWGCGLSTIYFSKYLKDAGMDFEWHGIDNSKEWHEKIQKKIIEDGLADSVFLCLFEFVPFWLKPGWDWNNPARSGFGPKEENELRYISYPASLGIKYDVIIVDARFRRRCLIEAQKLLAPGGFVILHDAQKPHYHSPLGSYRYSRFIDSGFLYHSGGRTGVKMWIGSNDREIPA
jgi:hypothetical protein